MQHLIMKFVWFFMLSCNVSWKLLVGVESIFCWGSVNQKCCLMKCWINGQLLVLILFLKAQSLHLYLSLHCVFDDLEFSELPVQPSRYCISRPIYLIVLGFVLVPTLTFVGQILLDATTFILSFVLVLLPASLRLTCDVVASILQHVFFSGFGCLAAAYFWLDKLPHDHNQTHSKHMPNSDSYNRSCNHYSCMTFPAAIHAGCIP